MKDWIGDVVFIGVLALAVLILSIVAVVKGRLGNIPVFFSMLFSSRAEFERELKRCSRGPNYEPARRPGDLNETFAAIMSGAFSEYAPRVVNTDPWIVYFDNFLSEAEVAEYEETLFDLELVRSKVTLDDSAFSKLITKIPFVKQMRWQNSPRNSLIRVCDLRCKTAPIVRKVEERASRICHVPLEHFETVQPFTYKEGMFYKAHTDNGQYDHLLPSGTRIFTLLVYLTDVRAGGGTRFNKLDLHVPARKGAAVLFVNTLDSDPMKTDPRTLHEGVMVLAGEKRGVNLWMRQYNHREFEVAQCTGTQLSHRLAWYGKAAVTDDDRRVERRPPGQPLVKIGNELDAAIRVLWVEPRTGKEQFLKALEPGELHWVNALVGHEFRLRPLGDDTTLLKRYVVGKAMEGQEVVVEPEDASGGRGDEADL